jgi:alkylation response protein AidB-like acyl-CoA dehydrogenase
MIAEGAFASDVYTRRAAVAQTPRTVAVLPRSSPLDFRLSFTPAQEAFRREVRDWLRSSAPEELAHRPTTPADSHEQYVLRRAFGRRLGGRGWLYPSAPIELGGGGLDPGRVLVLLEELHRVGLDLPPYYDSGGLVGSSTILVWGTEEQKQRFLPPIHRGEVRTWQLLTEPHAGSDLAAVRLAAVRDGDEWVLNGQKTWTGSAHGADRFWVLAMTDPQGARHQNLSWFMIDADLDGITTHPQRVLGGTGEGSADEGHKNTVFFDDVRVPADSLVGGENNGWRVAATHLELEHSELWESRKDRLWERLLDHCRTEVRDGRPLVEHDDVRDLLAEVYARSKTIDLLGQRNLWLKQAGRRPTYEGPQFFYLTKTRGRWLTRALLDLLGPSALTSDAALGAMDGHAERQARDGIVGMYPGGTADIQRVIIARRLGIGDRAPEAAGTLADR